MSQYSHPSVAGVDVSKPTAARLTDEQLLRREADWARTAMSRATEKIKQATLQAADPTVWVEAHPWMSVGAAAAVGFAAAKAVRTPREERVIAEYLRATRRGETSGVTPAEPAPRVRGRSATLFSLLQTAAMQIPAILSQLQAADAARAAAESATRTADAARTTADPAAPNTASADDVSNTFPAGF